MKTLLLIFLLSFTCKSQPIARDKIIHMAVGGIISYGIGKYTYKVTDRFGLSLLTGAVISAVTTRVKERVWDGMLGKGQKSIEDEVYGYAGCAYGTFALTVDLGSHIKKENIEYEKYNFKTDTTLKP